MNYSRAIIIACLLIFLIFLIPKIYQGFFDNEKALDEDLPSTYSLRPDISSLLAEKYRVNLKVIEVNQSKVREPISIIAFNNKYRLVAYKIKLEKDISLNTLLQSEIKDADISNGFSYGTIGTDIIYRFRYKAGLVKPANQVYLTFYGDSLRKTAANDTVVAYHLIAGTFSIRYSKEDAVDILVTGEEKPFGITTKVPIDILFLKRKDDLYLLLLTPETPDDSISADLLYTIVTDK